MDNKKLFTVSIKSVKLFKFNGGKKDFIDILAQVNEISFYQSIFQPLYRCEMVLLDAIGLFVNFPLTGEEIIDIKYQTNVDRVGIGDGEIINHQFVIDSVEDITPSDKARDVAFILNLISIEALPNSMQLVSQAYNGKITDTAVSLFDEYISKRTSLLFPQYRKKPLKVRDPSDLSKTIVVPNLHPFSALSWLTRYAVSPDSNKHTYILYQNNSGFNLSTIQSLTSVPKTTKLKKFRYFSDETPGFKDDLKKSGDDFTPITNIVINKRYETLEKINMGYFQNGFMEINLMQKLYNMTETTNKDLLTITGKSFNTPAYEKAVRIGKSSPDQKSKVITTKNNIEDLNRVHYSYNNRLDQADNNSYPLETFKNKWGKSTAYNLALAQIDFHITVSGDMTIQAGDLVICEIPEMHGFNKLGKDKIISGRFLVTEVKQLISQGMQHSTVMRLNKDSYEISVDYKNKYGANKK